MFLVASSTPWPYCNQKESGRQDNKPNYMYGPKQNWNFLVSYSKQHLLTLSFALCHRILLPTFTDLQQNQLMHTQIGKAITESKTYALHPLEWPETISYLTPMHIIKNQTSIEVWPLRSELSRFTQSIEPLTHSPLNPTMQRASTLLV
jgi:hypothetical protein